VISTIEQQIEAALNKIRPFLRREGGDVSFVSYADGIAKVQMHGACLECLVSIDTIASIEYLIIDEVPGVVKVEVLTTPPESTNPPSNKQ